MANYWWMQPSHGSKQANKRYKKAEMGESVTEWVGGSLRTYIKGGSMDPRGGGGGYAGRTEQASRDYSKDLRAIAEQMLQAADPFRGQRQQYQKMLSDLYKDPSSITKLPGYQFRLEQGQKALERSMAAKGMLQSGNLALELQRYGQNFASTEFDRQAQRLAQLSGAAPGSPAAGAQLGAGLLSTAAGEDFNRGGYAAFEQAMATGAPGMPAIGATPTTIDRPSSTWQNPLATPATRLGDPFAPMEPISTGILARTKAQLGYGDGDATASQNVVDTARSVSGTTPGGPSIGTGKGYFTSSGGGGGTFGGYGGDMETMAGLEETGDLGFEDTEFSIWGTHF